MKVDADFTRGASRLIYPELPDPLTSAELKRFFSQSHAEREWAPTIARSSTSQVVLLVQLTGSPHDWPHRSRMPIAAMYSRPSHTAVGWDRRKRRGT